MFTSFKNLFYLFYLINIESTIIKNLKDKVMVKFYYRRNNMKKYFNDARDKFFNKTPRGVILKISDLEQ